MIRWVLFLALIFVLLLARSEDNGEEKSEDDVQIYDNVTIGYTRPPRLTHAQKIEIFFTAVLVYVLAGIAIIGVCSFAYRFLRPETGERVHERSRRPPNHFEGAEYQRNEENVRLNRAAAPVVPGEY
ncbi:Protein CBG27295 [Caenorhabditis briggsae]|uniref:Protein CBG27295 n=2 Tax=Caenorhabditis briggsae TaxID=6238 RepID=B6IM72_CAEBR|nr:Protein CBG27295 [Caenorhabditis briggsae]ULT92065.1 hypothetical protein L3Y34_009641 [Caenorhabditis briggsae]CAS01002.1 Protein CBG27295 [Caenorhabditis briggsae]